MYGDREYRGWSRVESAQRPLANQYEPTSSMLGEQAARRASPNMPGEHASSCARRYLPSVLGEHARSKIDRRAEV
uniref:Uncharacterized protein n=1 Tax=Romanomermis culicivorax TaxID=13658 RepID=A0A915IYA3_ROMCU